MIISKEPSFLKTKLFWATLVSISLLGTLGTIKYFTTACPIVSVAITMDRNQALQEAKFLASNHDWDITNFKSAASFDQDSKVQTFAELECGGIETFKTMMQKELYIPYQWHVRFFKECDPYEVHILYTPTGKPYGYKIKIPESYNIPSVSQKVARALAQEELNDWNIDLNLYEESETSENSVPNGRIDHTFTYKRTDVTLGQEGTYRIKIVVSGNRVTQLQHYIHIPESFIKKFEEMRSANTTLGTGFQVLFILLYIILGALGGSIILSRNRRIITYPTVFIATGIALLCACNSINMLPIELMNYQTTTPLITYYLQHALKAILIFIQIFALLFLSLTAAEGLDRWAFGNHLQWIRLFSKSTRESQLFNNQTLIGYLFVGIAFGMATILYYIFITWFGWWAPADTLVDPSIVAVYLPSLTPLATALQAGILEEALFRAIPLAGSVLLGKYFKKEKLFLIVGFIIQALIFGGAHVNYPQMPAYFRLIELIPMSFLFGTLYLIFGLYPVMIIHVVYDLILMSISLFSTQGIYMLINKILIIIAALIPLFFSLYSYIKNQYSELTLINFNEGWIATKSKQQIVTSSEKTPEKPRSKKAVIIACIIGCMSLITLGTLLITTQKYKNTLTLSEADARSYAADVIESVEQDSKSWTILAQAKSTDLLHCEGEKYLWQSEGPDTYRNLIGSYVADSYWEIRYALFEGKPEERAESYNISIDSHGNIIRIQHTLAENAPGKSLSKPHARGIALEKIKKLYELDLDNLQEISAVEIDKPARKDYIFTFQDTSVEFKNTHDQARIMITITGDEISDYGRYIFTPEEWIRKDTLQKTMLHIIYLIAFLLFGTLVLLGYSCMESTLTTFSIGSLIRWFIPFFCLAVLQFFNKLPFYIFSFSTSEPFSNQLFIIVTLGICIILLYQLFLTAYISQLGKTLSLITNNDSLLETVGFGLFFGIITSSILIITNRLCNTYQPKIGNLLALSYKSPFCATIFGTILYFFITTDFLLIISNYILRSKNTYRYILTFFGLFSGLCILLLQHPVESLYGCLLGALLGTLVLGSFLYSLKSTSILIGIPAIAIIILVQLLQEMILYPYQSIIFTTLMTSITLMMVTFWFFKKLWVKKNMHL